jgi:hypothetical protein
VFNWRKHLNRRFLNDQIRNSRHHGIRIAGPTGHTHVRNGTCTTSTQKRFQHALDLEFWEHLPLNSHDSASSIVRDSFVEKRGPAATAGINGGTPEQTHVFWEGFQINGTLASSRYFGLHSLNRMELESAGYGARLSFVPGGALWMSQDKTSGPLKAKLIGLGDIPFASSQEATALNQSSSAVHAAASLSGELLPGKLSIGANVEFGRDSGDAIVYPAGIEQNIQGSQQATLHASSKLNLQIAERHSLALVFAAHSSSERNLLYQGSIDQAARVSRADRFWLLGLIWKKESLQGLQFTTRLGVQRSEANVRPTLCSEAGVDCQTIAPLVQLDPLYFYQIAPWIDTPVQTSLDASASAKVPVGESRWVKHEITANIRTRVSVQNDKTILVSGSRYIFEGDSPFIRQDQFMATRDPNDLRPGWFTDQATYRMLTVSQATHT